MTSYFALQQSNFSLQDGGSGTKIAPCLFGKTLALVAVGMNRPRSSACSDRFLGDIHSQVKSREVAAFSPLTAKGEPCYQQTAIGGCRKPAEAPLALGVLVCHPWLQTCSVAPIALYG